jgi:uncharacterized membrane protein YtjA (UPF0391 family)
MFAWAVTFLILVIVSAYLGFVGLSGIAAVMVQLLFLVFLILLAASTLVSLTHDEPPPL